MRAIKYVGKNESYLDPVTDSGVTWKLGETIWMPEEFWDRVKVHSDVWEIDAKTEKKVMEDGEAVPISEEVATAVAGLKKKASGLIKRLR
jgi:hypothetical protein